MNPNDGSDLPSVFSFDGRAVRTVNRDGEVWFVGRDVCDCLGHKNAADRLGRLDLDERMGVGIADPHGRVQETVVISEAGVYQLIFSSRVEAAQRFKRWLAHDVLPALRRQGSYGATPLTIPPGTREFTDAIQAVRETRLMAGNRAALALWAALGLPAIEGPSHAVELRPSPAMLHRTAQFCVERVDRHDHGESIAVNVLWGAFTAWARARGEDPGNQSSFALAMQRHLPDKRMSANGELFYFDASLRPVSEAVEASAEP